MAADRRETGIISRLTLIKKYVSNWNVRETGGASTATFKLRDSLKHLTCNAIGAADGAAGNSTAGLHMFTVTLVTAYPAAAATGGETSVKGSSEDTWTEFTTAGSKIINLTSVPLYSRADGQAFSRANIVGRNIYITKAGAPATGVTPTNGQWFLALTQKATTVAAGMNNMYLPQASITVAATSGFDAAGNILVQTDQGIEKVSYTSVDATHFLGCTGGKGKLATSNTVKQPTIGDNTTTTYAFNVADGSLPSTNPPIIDTSGDLVASVLVAANQTASDPMGSNVRGLDNDGGLQVETGGSGTVEWEVHGQ